MSSEDDGLTRPDAERLERAQRILDDLGKLVDALAARGLIPRRRDPGAHDTEDFT